MDLNEYVRSKKTQVMKPSPPRPAPPAIAAPLVNRIYQIRKDLDVTKKEILWIGREPKEKKDRPATVSADQPLNTNEVAAAMGVHRSTVSNWKREGYRFEFGRLTTLDHLKKWLRNRQSRDPTTDDERARRAELLQSLR